MGNLKPAHPASALMAGKQQTQLRQVSAVISFIHFVPFDYTKKNLLFFLNDGNIMIIDSLPTLHHCTVHRGELSPIEAGNSPETQLGIRSRPAPVPDSLEDLLPCWCSKLCSDMSGVLPQPPPQSTLPLQQGGIWFQTQISAHVQWKLGRGSSLLHCVSASQRRVVGE